jgi:hypothetical protein
MASSAPESVGCIQLSQGLQNFLVAGHLLGITVIQEGQLVIHDNQFPLHPIALFIILLPRGPGQRCPLFLLQIVQARSK